MRVLMRKASGSRKKRSSNTLKPTYRMRIGQGTPHLQKMFKHIYNSLRDQGRDHAESERIASAKVNQLRRKRGLLIEDVGRARWYPGKPTVKGRYARAAQLLAEGDVEGASALLAQSKTASRGKRRV